jgi:16S rRNA (adenine1518-N6/adenine1519-N6)-dimethyltransferase
MVQKEVGDRFSAKLGTKEYNSLTLYLNYYFKISKVMDVSRNSFIPKPNVDSAGIKFERYYRDDCKNENILFNLIRDSFQFKRKNLRNNLKNYDLVKIEKVLNKYGKDLTVRAENLSLEEFIDISNNLEG